jgi:hypothetical protein
VSLRDGGQVEVLFNADESQGSRSVSLTDHHPPATLTVAPQRPALMWFNGRGALRAVETQGACRIGNERVVEDTTDGIVLSLDGHDLRKSKALLFMPLKAGTVRLRSTAEWRLPILETGEIQAGSWRTYEIRSAVPDGEALTVNVTPDQAFGLLLLGEQAEIPRWRRAVERAICDPASLP